MLPVGPLQGVQPVEDCAAMRQAVPQRGMTAAAHNVAPQHGVFAVVEVSGTQHKVAPGDVVVVEKLEADVDDRLQLRRVLLLGSRAETVIGRPYVPQAVVTAAVEVRALAVTRAWAPFTGGCARHHVCAGPALLCWWRAGAVVGRQGAGLPQAAPQELAAPAGPPPGASGGAAARLLGL